MLKRVIITGVLASLAFAQDGKTPTFDSRLTVHTLVREDIFAGFMANDSERLARGENNVELLLQQRPNDKAPLLAWKAAIALTRATNAYEAKRTADFQREYQKAVDLLAEARRTDPRDGGVLAITGGVYSVFGDRLPEPQRSAAWAAAYDAYRAMYQVQSLGVDRMPVHLKGELLAGMAQSAQRTGHQEEAAQFLDRIVKTMPETPYASMAQKWIDKPEIAATTKVTCQTCHEPGRLAARTAALK
jgi:tetratricopeptide (TPR) repeat protein